MPNALAYAMLLLWPLVTFALFRALGPGRGLVASLLGGYLLLPPGQPSFELPVLPSLNKATIPSFAALAACLLLYRPFLRLLPESRMARLLVAAYLTAPLLALLTNLEPVHWGTFSVPGMKPRAVVAAALGQLATIAPFLLARALLAREEDLRMLLWAILIGTLLYSLPMLVEVRLSPQVNTWVYGFFQHSFVQMMRGGGFRPIVFLYHGLWAAFLVCTAVLACCALLRVVEEKRTVGVAVAAVWLMGVLVLCKSMASLVYALAGAPLVLFATARMQVRFAAVVVVLALAYPIMRGADIVPVQRMVELAARVSPERAGSLQFRFDNEMVLLDHAQKKPLFGWGGWGRNLIYEADSGRSTGVPDGQWIIALGSVGWFGFGAEFGLLALPLLLVWWKGGPAPPRVIAGAAVILAINMGDLMPNATITPLTWLFAGSLLGWAEHWQAPVTAHEPMPVLLPPDHAAAIRTVL